MIVRKRYGKQEICKKTNLSYEKDLHFSENVVQCKRTILLLTTYTANQNIL